MGYCAFSKSQVGVVCRVAVMPVVLMGGLGIILCQRTECLPFCFQGVHMAWKHARLLDAADAWIAIASMLPGSR